MKLGVMGGTFDPIHTGHLILADAARQQLFLDKVRFIPAGDPWRKADRAVTAAQHRLAMTRLAVHDNDAFEVDDREVKRSGPSYTAETLRELRAERPQDELYFLAGEDALADLPNWREPEAIGELAYFVVAPREGAQAAPDVVPRARLIRLDMPHIGISSSRLREMARAGLSLRYQVPDAVVEYINRNRLYAASPD